MKRIGELRKALGVRAFKRVLAERPNLKKDREALARVAKRKSATIKGTAEMIGEVVDTLAKRRAIPGWARRRGLVNRCGWRHEDTGVAVRGCHYGRSAITLPKGTLPERLHRYYVADVRQSLRWALRSYTRQSDTRVSVTTEFGRARITLYKDEGWIDYKDRNRYGIVDAHYDATVLKGWRSLPDWLRVCDGMLTLAAIHQQDDEQEGETIYRARWAVQKAGDVDYVEGFIVRLDRDGRRYTAHGKSIGAARGCITKQLPEWIAAATERERERAIRIERVKTRICKALERGKLNGYDVPVTIADSTRAGNCPTGTMNWVAKHFPDRESAMVSDILDIHDEHERVLLACVSAIRRQRPEVFADSR